MDPNRVSNLDKACENARAFGDEVRRLVPLRLTRSMRRAA
jgi:chromosome partitioning protein